MGPIIILDKSTLQTLTRDEIFFLNKYYSPNYIPVIIQEVLSNIRRFPDKRKSEKIAASLANKIKMFSYRMNTQYQDVLIQSLLGNEIQSYGRPAIIGGRSIENPSGEKGIIFRKSAEEDAIDRWAIGDFNSEDEKLAIRWRDSIKKIDYTVIKNQLEDIWSNLPKINSLESLNKSVEQIIHNPKIQKDLLMYLIYDVVSRVKNELISKMLFRWECEQNPKIKEFAPYAFYCLKINLLFELGLKSGQIGVKPSNRIDMEYFYYLPFCNVFSPRDKLHKRLFPFVMNEECIFIWGDDLKNEFNEMNAHWTAFDELGKKEFNDKYRHAPPNNENSITTRIWSKFMNYPEMLYPEPTPELSKENEKKLVDMINKKREGKAIDRINSDDADFLIIESTISYDDQCTCYSGEIFGKCCGKRLF